MGLIYDQNGEIVVQKDGSQFISSDNDFSSLMQVGGKLFNITHFESRPGAMYLTELSQDPSNGVLTPVRTQNIDFSEWGGLWVPCAGSVTPWNMKMLSIRDCRKRSPGPEPRVPMASDIKFTGQA